MHIVKWEVIEMNVTKLTMVANQTIYIAINEYEKLLASFLEGFIPKEVFLKEAQAVLEEGVRGKTLADISAKKEFAKRRDDFLKRRENPKAW